MKLRDLREILSELYCKQIDAAEDFIFKASYKLIPLLLELAKQNQNVLLKERSEYVLDLRNLIDNAAIRYCGRFFNQIRISKEERLADKRLSLRFVPYSKESPLNQYYTEDNYSVQNIHNAEIDSTNVIEFIRFAKGLARFFRQSKLHDNFMSYLNELDERLSEFDRITNEIYNEFDEAKFPVFDRIFSTYNCLDDNKRILIFPDNVSIRYRGKFHNCLIYDNYDICIGYVINNYDISDECYSSDEYTKSYDSEKYESKTYTLIHEYSLSTNYGGTRETEEVYAAINALVQLFENELEADAPVMKYIEATNVRYRHYSNEKTEA